MDPKEKTTSSEDQHQLAWSQEIPNYGNKLLKRLDEFRKTTILYDVKVRADGGDFNAHKVILAACGGLFRTCFVDEKKKMISGEISELNLDCPVQGLKTIIRFAYSGALVVTKRNAIATMIAAEVTKMKEIQEICADIAVKEYGWVIRFVGEKDAPTIDNLAKVLQLHAPCFSAVQSNGTLDSGDGRVLPFKEEVDKQFPEHKTTYQRLALKLESAEAIVAATKPEESASKAPSVAPEPDGDNETPIVENKQNPTAAKRTSPVPTARLTKPGSDEGNEKQDTAVAPAAKTPKKPATRPPPRFQDGAIHKPPRPPVAHERAKSDTTTESESAADAKSTPPASGATSHQPGQSSESTAVTGDGLEKAGADGAKSSEKSDANVTSDKKTPKKPENPPTLKGKVVDAPNSKPPRPPSAHKKTRSDSSVESESAGDAKSSLMGSDGDSSEPTTVPVDEQEKTASDGENDVKIQEKSDTKAVPGTKTPKKPANPPVSKVKLVDPAKPRPTPPPGSHNKTKLDMTDKASLADTQSTSPASNDKSPKRPSPPPAMKISERENASSATSLSNGVANNHASVPEKEGPKITVVNAEKEPSLVPSEATLKKQAPPASPRVKPRGSVKKPAPAPPTSSPGPLAPAERSTKSTAPARPKAPAKVPPPRPKPPSSKKSSTGPEGTPTKKQTKEMLDDYDDNLNPFA